MKPFSSAAKAPPASPAKRRPSLDPTDYPAFADAWKRLQELNARRDDLDRRIQRALAPQTNEDVADRSAVYAMVVGIEAMPADERLNMISNANIPAVYGSSDQPREAPRPLQEQRAQVLAAIPLQQQICDRILARLSSETAAAYIEDYRPIVSTVAVAIRALHTAVSAERKFRDDFVAQGMLFREPLHPMPFGGYFLDVNQHGSAASEFMKEAEQHGLLG